VPSITLITYFYPNISGWPRSLRSHKVMTQRVSPVIFKIMGPTYWYHNLDLSGSRNVSRHVTFWFPCAISDRCSIVTESLSPAIFEIICSKHIGVTTLAFLDHMTSSVTWQKDPPYDISYWCPIGTESPSSTVFEIFASKYNWDTILKILGHVTSSVTRPFDSPGATSYRCSIVTDSLSPTIFEIMGIFISGSRPWPFKITWRHRSRDQSISHMSFPVGVPL